MSDWHVVGSKTFSVQVYPNNPVKSWNAGIDKTKVKPGDTITVTATVDWEWPGAVQFKLGVTGFNGKLGVLTQPVTAQSSPTTIKTTVKVPQVQDGNYQLQVYLHAYY